MGGLTVTLTVSQGSTTPGPPVGVTLNAQETAANGALGYQVSYGDGSGDQNVVPTLCTAGRGSPETQTWYLTHTYRAAGSYTITATVYVSCGHDRATATAPEKVS